MWSINEDYNATNLAIVTVCIGLATYAVVANLETTVHMLKRGVSVLFNTPRQRLVGKMKVERDTRWRSLAEEMSKVPLSREDPKPSEWLIFGYWCATIYRSLRNLYGTQQESIQEEEAKPAEDPQGYWLATIYNHLQSRKQKEEQAETPELEMMKTQSRADYRARLQAQWNERWRSMPRRFAEHFSQAGRKKAAGAKAEEENKIPVS